MNQLILTLLCTSFLYSWPKEEPQLVQVKSEFLDCTQTSGNCEGYTYEAMRLVYSSQENKEYTDNHSFVQALKSSSNWKELGPGYNQHVLEKAQQAANSGQAAVAVYFGQGKEPLHVAVILPGELSTSGSWGLQVPNSISLPDFEPDHSYIGKPLSYAFEKRMLLSLKIYVHK